jgi:hypothetical protein
MTERLGTNNDIIMGLLTAVLLSVMITEVYTTTITNATTASTPNSMQIYVQR